MDRVEHWGTLKQIKEKTADNLTLIFNKPSMNLMPVGMRQFGAVSGKGTTYYL